MKNIKIIKAKYIVESDRRKGKAVMCLDTGEVFTSAKECADVKHFPYANFHVKLRDGKPAVDKYINNFLCGGCSKDPIDLLKSAGVDMSTPKPVDDALNVFEDYLKKLETTV